MPTRGTILSASLKLPVGLALSSPISSNRWTSERSPHPAVESQDESWRHLHAPQPRPRLHMKGPGEAAWLPFGSSSQHSFSITWIEGPVYYYILDSLSPHITLMRYHFSLLECHNKKRGVRAWQHLSVLQILIWNIGLNQFHVTLVVASCPHRVRSFIWTM